MANHVNRSFNKNPYKGRLTLLTSIGNGRILDKNVASAMDWVDPARQLINVEERIIGDEEIKMTTFTPIKGHLLCPAISVLLFMREYGEVCYKDIQKLLRKPPWKFHHKVELQHKRTPKTAVASQEFYELDRHLPLFAACPVLTETEIIRIQLYVRNFTTMVEFYRTITEIEIETNKPDFCIFELYRQSNLALQLSLKRCEYISPVNLKSAYISFNVKSIRDVQLTTDAKIDYIGENVFKTCDPEGNMIILYECNEESQEEIAACGIKEYTPSCNTNRLGTPSEPVADDDGKSVGSTFGSQDSGHATDEDGALEGLVTSVSNQCTLAEPRCCNEVTESRDKSDGYGSSDTSTSLTWGKPPKTIPSVTCSSVSNSSLTNRKQIVREINSLRRKRPGSYKHKKAFSTPVYI